MPADTLLAFLTAKVEAALAEIGAPEGADPAVAVSDRADYQCNAALPLAKPMGANPRQIAERLVAALDRSGIAAAEIAGPGFVNLTLTDDLLAERAECASDRPTNADPKTIVVDYSGPNVAKEMHIGHLRSTVIGDALRRMFEFAGEHVVPQNHLGDWGTQFGKLVQYLDEAGIEVTDEASAADMSTWYTAAQARDDADAAFAERARHRVVLLQGGDAATGAIWHHLYAATRRHFRETYGRLGVLLTEADERGESSFNTELDGVASELEAMGLATIDAGALCIFLGDGFNAPVIVRKSNGGYGYHATDLAAVRHRVDDLEADRIVYVVDARQSDHFAMLFAAARRAGWLPEAVDAVHVGFGIIVGPDGKVFKTRDGGVPTLKSVMDLACDQAAAILAEKRPDMDLRQAGELAATIGIGALKYGDLSHHRARDFTFDLDRMVSFDGNTAPYLQYACTRIASLFRRAELGEPRSLGELALAEPAERALALQLARFPEVLASAIELFEPHRVCQYLFETAGAFTSFYEACPVLSSPEPVRSQRLSLAAATHRVLSTGLGLMGIGVPAEM